MQRPVIRRHQWHRARRVSLASFGFCWGGVAGWDARGDGVTNGCVVTCAGMCGARDRIWWLFATSHHGTLR
jgi:dienelactone hydrolase